MQTSFVRPDVADLTLRVYARVLHPELVETLGRAWVRGTDWTLELTLNSAGHAAVFRSGEQILTEVITPRDTPMPPRKKLFDQRLRGCRTQSLDIAPGLRYDVSCHIERVDPLVYLQLHEELLRDSATADLAQVFPSQTRFSPGAVSVIRTETSRDGVLIHAFHSFPEHFSLVKTQSLVEWS